MSSLGDLVSDLETAIDAITPGTRSRMSQDYGTRTTEFTALGQTRYQIQATHLNTDDLTSAKAETICQVEIVVHHALSTLQDEQAYTVGQMATDQLALLQNAFWEDLAAVFSLIAGFPALQGTVERSGKLITYTVGAQVALN